MSAVATARHVTLPSSADTDPLKASACTNSHTHTHTQARHVALQRRHMDPLKASACARTHTQAQSEARR